MPGGAASAGQAVIKGTNSAAPLWLACRMPQMRWRAAAFKISSSVSLRADPMCSMRPQPSREECTIRTAITPDAVFTVRTYGSRHSTTPD
jgi:hypothetical protein